MVGGSRAFGPVEVAKAISSMAKGKTAGPDRFAAGVLRRLPCLHQATRLLRNCFAGEGNPPNDLLELRINTLVNPKITQNYAPLKGRFLL